MKKAILVIDDDQNGRDVVRRFLAPFANQIEIIEAHNYNEAIDLLRNSHDCPDKSTSIVLVFTDLNLEDYNRKEGLDVIDYVDRYMRQTTKVVLYSSGNPAWTVSRHLKMFEDTVLSFWCPLEELSEGRREYKDAIWNVLDGSKEVRSNIFVSYSHADREWLKRIHVHLKPFERNGTINLWDDTKIIPGKKWRDEIQVNLECAKIALMLVSADFLASDFIANHELPHMLEMAKNAGTEIIPVIIKPCAYTESELNIFQSFNPPTEPLIGMNRTKREKLFVSLAQRIKDLV